MGGGIGISLVLIDCDRIGCGLSGLQQRWRLGGLFLIWLTFLALLWGTRFWGPRETFGG